MKELWTDILWLFRLGHLEDIFSKMNTGSLTFQGNSWQYLLARIKFELSSKNQNLGKFICLYELDTFSIQKDFSNEMNKCYYLIIYNKMFQHLEISIIQWTNIFQMTKAWCYKVKHGRTYKDYLMTLMSWSWKVHWYGLFPHCN